MAGAVAILFLLKQQGQDLWVVVGWLNNLHKTEGSPGLRRLCYTNQLLYPTNCYGRESPLLSCT
jgi:hypothetical protein